MTQALSGAAIAAVIAACWLLGRPRPKILRSTDTSAVAALNRGQLERLLDPSGAAPAAASLEAAADAAAAAAAAELCWPRSARDRAVLLRQLEQQFSRAGEPRRQALALAAAWGDRSTLPLIRRGLRDGDPAVVALAAQAMASFRGQPTAAGGAGAAAQPAARAPRNVSRTR